LVAALVLGASAVRRASSSLALSTTAILDLGFRISDLLFGKPQIRNPHSEIPNLIERLLVEVY
jgi:hypothetical protein